MSSRDLQKRPGGGGGEDLWTLIDNEPNDYYEDSADTTTLFIGDSGCGKSTLINSFLKPNVSKEPKPTFALDYNFARKKAGSANANSKSVAHIWELGGDINEPRLLDVPVTVYNLTSTSIVIVCDLSKPQNCLSSLLKWLKRVREVVDRRIKDLQSTDSGAAAALRDAVNAPYRTHSKDSNRVKPCEVSLYIVANKYDKFQGQNLADRRCLMQVLRFVAHYHGATLITTSNADATLKDSFRASMTGICFRTTAKAVCEVALDKPVTVSVGRDDFESILLATTRATPAATEGDAHAAAALARKIVESKDKEKSQGKGGKDDRGNSRLANGPEDVDQYLTGSGPTRDCWNRLADHVKSVFGSVETGSAEEKGQEDFESGTGAEDKGAGKDDEQYPEADVDEMRAQRDAALERYVQEAERREYMTAKMNASHTRPAATGGGGGSGSGEWEWEWEWQWQWQWQWQWEWQWQWQWQWEWEWEWYQQGRR